MPEGPEIRLAADRVAKVLEGRTVVEARFGLERLKGFESRLSGAVVDAVATRGKAMLTHFDNGLTLYSHNQLYGRWYTTRRPQLPDTGRQLRVALHTSTHSALLYSASDVAVLTRRELSAHPFLARLGPDILDDELTAARVRARLEDARFSRRSLAALYLDQGFLAGVGNYLRSEILWSGRVHPSCKPAEIGAGEKMKLARATLRISRRAYRQRGVTVRPGLAKRLKAKGTPYRDYRFQVYGREALPCRECDTLVVRQDLSGRAIYFCPGCQQR